MYFKVLLCLNRSFYCLFIVVPLPSVMLLGTQARESLSRLFMPSNQENMEQLVFVMG